MTYRIQKVRVARGVPKGEYVGVAVRLDPETFQQVRERAIREGTSFGEQVRCLIEWGLEA